MRAGRLMPSGIWMCVFFFTLSSWGGYVASLASAAEKTAEKTEAADGKNTFNLILPYTDVTVGQGQEVTMDTEVVNRTKNPVQVLLSTESVPQGWEVGFHSRYPSYPVRSVMVQGEKSTTIEFKAKVPEKTKPGDYQLTVSAKDESGATSRVEKVTFRITSKKVETGGLKLSSQYPVLSTPTGQTLKFTVDLKNETNKPLTASLVAQSPDGWVVRFKPQFGDTVIS
ncbi:MAG: NEW3 domain-containing protein, partial [Candidatus Binatia bacterium]